MRFMRIGVFTDSYLPTVDGIVNSILNTRAELERQGHEVHVFAPKPHKDVTLEVDENTHLFKANIFKPYPSYHMAWLPANANKLVKDLDLDIIHSHGIAFVGYKAVWTSFTMDIPIVVTYHTMVNDVLRTYLTDGRLVEVVNRLLWSYSRWYFRRCDAILLPSKATKEEMRKQCGKANMLRAYVVPSGVASQHYIKDGDRQKGCKKLKLDPENRFLLHFGRIAREKRLELIFEAMPQIRRTHPRAKLLVAGKGPALGYYKELAKSLQITDMVRFLGFIPDHKLPALYNASELFVTASKFETQGLVILEAMAAGKPCVGPSFRAIPEIIKDDVNGHLFPPDNVMGCVKAIITTLDDRDHLAQGARRSAQEYSVEKCTHRLVDVYDMVLARHAKSKQTQT